MNRQMQRRVQRNLGIKHKDVEELSKFFYEQGEEDRKMLVYKFLGVCMEALRLEFGFGDKRLGRFGARVESLLDSINLDYVTFEDILDDLSIKHHVVHRIKDKRK